MSQPHCSSGSEATTDVLAKKHGVHVAVSSQIGLAHHLDTWMTPNVLYRHRIRRMSGILSVHDTPQRLCGLKNGSRAQIHKVVSKKWMKYHFLRELSL